MLNKAMLLMMGGSKSVGKDNFDITFTTSGGIRPESTWNIENHAGEVPYFKNKDNFLKNISSNMYGTNIVSSAPIRVESPADAVQILLDDGASGKFDVVEGGTLINNSSENIMSLSGTHNIKFNPPPTGWLKQCKVTVSYIGNNNVQTPNKTIYEGSSDIAPFYIPEEATIYANAYRGSIYVKATPSSNAEVSRIDEMRAGIKILGDCTLDISSGL